MFKILAKNISFRYLWLGQLISSLGDRLTQMGILTFLMVASGDKGDKMALITFFSLLPFLLFGPLFGALADRYSRKKIMIFADIARATLVLFIPFLWMHTHSLFIMIGWFFALGSLTALFTPAKMSIIPNISDKDTLLEANSMIVTTGMVATLIGTLIAGFVIKVFGVRPAFYINSLTYIISALFILKIIYKKEAIDTNKQAYGALIGDIKFGIAYMLRHSLIMRMVVLSSIFSFVSAFAYILILNYGTTILGRDSLGIGVLLSSAGFGMISGALFLIRRKDRVSYSRLIYLAYLIIGIFSSVFLLKPDYHLSCLILFFAGLGASILTITLDTVFQRIIPDDLKGKIFAVRGVFANSVFLVSLLLVGFLIKRFSPGLLFGLIGLVSIVTFLSTALYERRWGYQVLRFFMRLVMLALFNFKVSGLENIPKSKRFILAGNHTSVIDGAALACAYPGRVYFLVADSIFKHKFWGWCVKRLGYIPVKRGGFNKEGIKTAIELLSAGFPVGIFPEGKISADDKMLEAKAGIAVIAKLANVDIVPFAIEGAHEAWPLPDKFPRRFPIEVRFDKPVDIEKYAAPEELVSEVMKDIARVKLTLEREGYLRVDPNEIIKHLINIG